MADFDKSTFDPKAAAEARKQEMDQITEKLEAGVKEIFSGDNYKNYLDFCAKLPRYSVNNQILIMMQKPDATMCQSFSGWKEMNRFVRKGEKGIRVLAPAPYKMEREQDKLDASGKPVLDKDGEPVKEVVEVKVMAFKPVSTFDISQTEGDPVPTLGVNELIGGVEGYDTLIEAIKSAVGVPVSFEQIESGAKGYFSLEENRIAIQEGMSEVQTIKTLLHESGHAALHSREAMDKSDDKKSRNQKECEAESIAYVVCQHYGIDTSEYSFGYVAGWSGNQEVPELKASLDTIRRAASDLIIKIDEKVAELTNTQEKSKGDDFMDIDNWLKEHGDELPFDNPGAGIATGYVEINPPVDLSKSDNTQSIALKVETEPDKAQAVTPKDEPDKASAKEDNTQESKQDEKKSEKKKSVKKQIADKKGKSEKTVKPKKVDTKNLGEAI